jgi:DNA-binding response OmpR family regulator
MISPLAGKLVLVVEDEVLVATELSRAFAEAGAHVVTLHNCKNALDLLTEWVWAGAIVDYNLGDANCDPLCEWFIRQNTPFIVYTGYDQVSDIASKGTLVGKPASSELLVELLGELVLDNSRLPF